LLRVACILYCSTEVNRFCWYR